MLTRSELRTFQNVAKRLGDEQQSRRENIDELDRQRLEHADRIVEIEQQLVVLNGMISEAASLFDVDVDPDEAQQEPKALRNETVRILRAGGQPVHYKLLYQRLVRDGFTVNGADPPKTLYAHLAADERFHKVGSGYWGLASWPRERLVVPEDDDDEPAPVPLRRPQPTVNARAVNHEDEFDDVPF